MIVFIIFGIFIFIAAMILTEIVKKSKKSLKLLELYRTEPQFSEGDVLYFYPPQNTKSIVEQVEAENPFLDTRAFITIIKIEKSSINGVYYVKYKYPNGALADCVDSAPAYDLRYYKKHN